MSDLLSPSKVLHGIKAEFPGAIATETHTVPTMASFEKFLDFAASHGENFGISEESDRDEATVDEHPLISEYTSHIAFLLSRCGDMVTVEHDTFGNQRNDVYGITNYTGARTEDKVALINQLGVGDEAVSTVVRFNEHGGNEDALFADAQQQHDACMELLLDGLLVTSESQRMRALMFGQNDPDGVAMYAQHALGADTGSGPSLAIQKLTLDRLMHYAGQNDE